MPRDGLIFKPENSRIVISIFAFPFIFFGCLFVTLATPKDFSWSGEGVFLIISGFLFISVPFTLRDIPKEIIFEDRIIVKRYLYPDLVIEYDDVRDIGSQFLSTKNGRINLYRMQNKQEFIEIINKLAQQGKIRLEGALAEKEGRDWGIFFVSLLPAIIVYLILKSQFSIPAELEKRGGFFSIVFLVVFLIMRLIFNR